MPASPEIGAPAGAVFLSYASQDSEAAKRICEALRAAGVEVWFDQSELRGGDAWDQSIRKQIRTCALFVPVISANTQVRLEGYFRLEWKLAEDRSHLIAKGKAFIVPVTVDGTGDYEAQVPDAFLAVQWTKLPGGETPPAFCERMKTLLGQQAPPTAGLSMPSSVKASWGSIFPAVAGVIVCLALALWRPWHKGGVAGPIESQAPVPQQTVVQSEARELVQRAGAVWDNGDDPSSEKMLAADELCARALTLDPTDAEVWAAASRIDAWMVFLNYDRSEVRRQKAEMGAARAVSLAPNLFAARRARACVYGLMVHTPEMLLEAEKTFRSLALQRPDDKSLAEELGIVLRDEGHFDEAGAIFQKAGLVQETGWNYFVANRFAEANRVADLLLARGHSRGALLLKAHVEYLGLEDVKAAYSATSQFTPVELQLEDEAAISVVVALGDREPEAAIRILEAFPHDFVGGGGYGSYPVRSWIGDAREMEAQPDAARIQWQVALQLVQDRLKAAPNDLQLIGHEAILFSRLGQPEDARHSLQLLQNLAPGGLQGQLGLWLTVMACLGEKEKILSEVTADYKSGDDGWPELHANLRFMPWFDFLRGDPRFEKLLRDTLPPGAKPFDDSAKGELGR